MAARHFHPDAKMSGAQERNKELDCSCREMSLARDTGSWMSNEAGSPDVCGVMARVQQSQGSFLRWPTVMGESAGKGKSDFSHGIKRRSSLFFFFLIPEV